MNAARPRVLPGLVVTLAAGALVVAVVLRSAGDGDPAGRARPPAAPTFVLDGERHRYPTPADAPDRPLGRPPEVLRADGFAFARTQPGGDEPVTWDPCRPIRVVVDDRTAPDGADDLLDDALDEVARATGLRVEVEGPTDEPPRPDRAPVQPDRYGDRWAPVLVAWTDPGAVPALEGDVGGLGGAVAAPLPEDEGSGEVYVTGTLLLDGPQMAASLRVVGGTDQVRSVLLHELGHVVGLAHVDDPGEVMHAEGQPGAAGYGTGDRAGLARLGRGPCRPGT